MSGPPRRRGQAGEHRLGESLDAFLRAQGHAEASALAAVWAVWAEVVGEEVAAHAAPAALRGTTLVVAVDQPAWATQLGFLSEQVCSRLADRLGSAVVLRLEATVRGS